MKRVISAILVIVIATSAQAKYSGGSGDPNTPYQIANVADLMTLANDANDYNKRFIQTSDIDLDPCLPGNRVFTAAVIGPANFSGVFDGNGHKIINLTINTSGAGINNLGFFASINGQVNNLKLENVSITDGNDSWSAGGLAGEHHGTINNCSSTGSVVIGNSAWDIGGLVGINVGGNISNSFSSCNVTTGYGSYFVGGFTGDSSGIITNCSSNGNVSCAGGTQYVGGFMGGADSGTISNCFSTGTVTGTYIVGGFVGALGDLTNPHISNCYSTGDVFGDVSGSGGFIGKGTGSTSYCYSTGKVCNGLGGGFSAGSNTIGCYFLDTAGQNNGYGTPLTDTQMKQQASFVGWDFLNIWIMRETIDYPLLIHLLGDSGNYGGGDGTTENPYLLNTASHLIYLRANNNDYNKHFAMTANIDLSEYIFNSAVIAPDTNSQIAGYQGTPFTGTFDGNGFTIQNLKIQCSGADMFNSYLGLFGQIGNSAQVIRLGLMDVNIEGTGSAFTGALAGESRGGIISQCFSTGNIKGDAHRGGLVGSNFAGSIINCYSGCSIPSVRAASKYAGGLVGDNNTVSASIVDCYSTGRVAGGGPSGGLIYGGLIGENYGTVTASFWDINTSGRTASAGGTGKTTAQMKMQSTFNAAGWDFVWETINGPNDVWAICEGVSYPKLAWQFIVGDSDNDKNVNFIDFATLANKWMQADSTLYCGGTDLTGDGLVDWNDLAAFVQNWLQEF